MKKKRAQSTPDANAQALTVDQPEGGDAAVDIDRFVDPQPATVGPLNQNLYLLSVGGVTTTVVNPMAVQSPVISSKVKPVAEASSGSTVSNYSPGFGNPGTVITINGSGFGLAQSNSFVDVQGQGYSAIWPYTSWSDTRIVVPVPTSAPLGKVFIYVYVNKLITQGMYPFTVGIPPKITSYAPGFGLPGTMIKIKGSGFGESYDSAGDRVFVLSSVTNRSAAWPVATWSDTEIDVKVPDGFSPGLVYLNVVSDNLQSIGTYPFTVGIPAEIECYSPVFGAPGTKVTINGNGFGNSQGNSSVQVETQSGKWTTWPVTTWADTQITVAVPENQPSGQYYLFVIVNNLKSIGTYPFQVGLPPVISTYSPDFGNPGTEITINGSGFGPAQGEGGIQALSTITNTASLLPVVSWTDTQVVVSIPETMPIGRIFLKALVPPLASIGTYPFDVGIPPIMTNFNPKTGPPGTTVTINGTGFGPSQGSSYVTLQSVTDVWTTLTVVNWSDTQITVNIPKVTPICPSYLSVWVDGLQSTNVSLFEVSPATN